MSNETDKATIEEITKLIQETVVEVAWRQWASLGAGALSAYDRRTLSIIDPEALLLLSLVIQDSERRLADFVAWWAKVGSRLLSVQRTKTMLRRFPPHTRHGMEDFAHLAVKAGDRRWKPYASENEPEWGYRRLKGAEEPRLVEGSTLILRFRAGFGVNAKADALAFLLGNRGESATVQEISNSITYSRVAVRSALKDMVLARLIHERPGQPVRYFIYLEPWSGLLDLQNSTDAGKPLWNNWYLVNAFLANSYVLFQQDNSTKKSAYVLSSKARNVVEEFCDAFSSNRISIPDPDAYRGAEYLDGFRCAILALKEWVLSVL